jgi:succinate dehydrogenase / fumarate reductase cytochrome b subunit
MAARARPLSPHLQIYRWQISNTLSILHRLSGIALACGSLALIYWLASLADDRDAYDIAARFFRSVPGTALLVGWTLGFFYHLLNGVRHLLWDAGLGFGRLQRHASGWAVVAGSVVLSTAVWAMLWHFARR